jgi:G3E family GTPase
MNEQLAPTNKFINIPKRGMPVTIITGFLGSGKTTLLNQILHNNEGLKIAVLVNEFGDIDIDSQLLVSAEAGMVQLSNGCICCTINEDLVAAIYDIMGREEKVDYLVIETTGVADPLPILTTFIGTELRDLTRIDSIVTVVDSDNFTPAHFESEAALNQIAYGDIILLNKIDLAPPEKLSELEKYLRQTKAGARIIPTEKCRVPLPLILDIGLFRSPQTQESTCEHHHHSKDHYPHSHHLENDGFVSVSLEIDRPLTVVKFQEFLNQLPPNVFRGKGLLWFQESKLRHIFQLSGKRYDITNDKWQRSPKNQLVLIGRNLDREALRQSFANCIA